MNVSVRSVQNKLNKYRRRKNVTQGITMQEPRRKDASMQLRTRFLPEVFLKLSKRKRVTLKAHFPDFQRLL